MFYGGERRVIGEKRLRSGGYYHVTGRRDVFSGGKKAFTGERVTEIKTRTVKDMHLF
ncbi:hypothetical protein JYA63_01165 [Fictibacillus nanhaiensis]|uniref:Uncharacterized protein n=1 Tax=Fictibacillus nanhaiensis TaxID=742169 RepID=A0ABS2ZKH3_9BACL|nr:hypothetical protein [Fictibacillus nanhaiensis]